MKSEENRKKKMYTVFCPLKFEEDEERMGKPSPVVYEFYINSVGLLFHRFADWVSISCSSNVS